MCTSDHFCLYTSIYDVHLWYSYIHVINTTLQQFCRKNCLFRCSESLQRVPLLPVWVCLPMHKPVKEEIESLKALQRKYGTTQTKSTSSLCIFAFNLSPEAASALDRSSKSACSSLLSWTCEPKSCEITQEGKSPASGGGQPFVSSAST